MANTVLNTKIGELEKKLPNVENEIPSASYELNKTDFNAKISSNEA